jgi:putative CocE/NonD family hydrolase
MTDARCFQIMVPMRDGTRLNTFVFLPKSGEPRWPVILHRTPYGIAAADARDKTDCTNAWLPSAAEPMRGSILRGWQQIVAHGYVAVYQDTRGRHASEGEDHVYADDAAAAACWRCPIWFWRRGSSCSVSHRDFCLWR